MKNKLIIIGLLLSSVFFSSCEDWLNPKPIDKQVSEDFWQTQSDVEAVVMSCYKEMTTNDFMDRIIVGGEVRSDNVIQGRGISGSEQSLQRLLDENILPNNSYASWNAFYNVINICNEVIEYAKGVPDIDPDYTPGLYGAHRAEALTIRGLVYFYLARLYKDVPYITWPYSEDTEEFNIPATSCDSILNWVVEGLIEAEKTAVSTYGASGIIPSTESGSLTWNTTNLLKNKGRITKNAVRALLADIYLWQNEYESCRDMCLKILDDVNTYEDYLYKFENNLLTGQELYLVENLTSTSATASSIGFTNLFYLKNSGESIFELQFDSSNDAEILRRLYGTETSLNGGSSHRLSATSDDVWKVFIRPQDVRVKDSYMPIENGYYQIFKYYGSIRTSSTSSNDDVYTTPDLFYPNWIFYRLSDVYLMLAEALVELGGSDELEEALEYVNITYMRSNPDISTPLRISAYPDQEAMRQLVLDERQREFLFEGKRWFDLLRMTRRINPGNPKNPDLSKIKKYMELRFKNGAPVTVTKMNTMDALYLPIAEKEITSNPILKEQQNPHYKEREEERE